MKKILRINMNSLEITEETSPEEYTYLGGRGLTSRIVLDEVEPLPPNKYIFDVKRESLVKMWKEI